MRGGCVWGGGEGGAGRSFSVFLQHKQQYSSAGRGAAVCFILLIPWMELYCKYRWGTTTGNMNTKQSLRLRSWYTKYKVHTIPIP